ncbi:hypothetical protein C8R47DRAFT_1320815 [Mycena vitilis]|nr:hypothetical protein C8R47DRAFT_1320815 [Mycena vitilis]
MTRTAAHGQYFAPRLTLHSGGACRCFRGISTEETAPQCLNCVPERPGRDTVPNLRASGPGLVKTLLTFSPDIAAETTPAWFEYPRVPSFEIDLDPIVTKYGTQAQNSSDRLVQYAMILDAPAPAPTSTSLMTAAHRLRAGTRSSRWPSFAGHPTEAAASLDEAMRVVPVSPQECTQAAVRASAGRRLLPGSQSAAILDAVAAHLQAAYPLALPDKDAIVEGAGASAFACLAFNSSAGPCPWIRQRTSCAHGRVHRVVNSVAPSAAAIINTPCLSCGTRRTEVTMVDADVGGYAACRRIVDLVLPTGTVCAVSPCALEGRALSEAFPQSAGRVLLLGYLTSTGASRRSLLLHSRKEPAATVTAGVIAELGGAVCLGREEWLRRWGAQTKLMEEFEGRPEWCLDLTYMNALLRTAYGLSDEREVIAGHRRFQWTFGAAIKLIGNGVKCRV